MQLYPSALREAFPNVEFMEGDELKPAYQLLEAFAIDRHFLQEKNTPDTNRMGKNILDDFRAGRFGRMSIDIIPSQV